MDIQNFSNGVINLPVRVLANGDIEFDAEQAAIGLGISRVAASGNTVVRWERVKQYLSCPQLGTGDFITEPQFYKLAFKAESKTAEKFQDWVSNDVLPSIRKYGMYATPNTVDKMLSNPDTMIEILTRYKASQAENQRLHDENLLMKPKAQFADSVATSNTTMLIGDLAKVLKGNGFEIGQNRLFEWLRNHGYLISRKGASYNMPTQRAMDLGLFKIKETAITHSDGHVTINKTVKVTGKGQVYFVDKFNQMYQLERA